MTFRETKPISHRLTGVNKSEVPTASHQHYQEGPEVYEEEQNQVQIKPALRNS